MDVQKALKDGYTKEEVMVELGKRTGMKYQQAIIDGWSPDDAISEMNRRDMGTGEKLTADPRKVSMATERKILDYTEPLVEGAAMIGGGALGSLGGPPGALLGAGGGYAAGRAINRGIREYLGMDPSTTGGEKVGQAIRDIPVGTVIAGAPGAAYEAVGKPVGQKIIAPFLSRTSQPETQALKNLAEKYKIDLTPEDIIKSPMLGQAESLVSKLWGSQEVLTNERLKAIRQLMDKKRLLSKGQATAEDIQLIGSEIKQEVNSFIQETDEFKKMNLNRARNEVLKKMGATDTYETIGTLTHEKLVDASRLVRERARTNYLDLEKYLTPGEAVPTPGAERVANEILKKIEVKPAEWQNTQLSKRLRGFLRKPDELRANFPAMSEDAMALNPELAAALGSEAKGGRDWLTIQDMRSDLNDWIVSGNIAFKSETPGFAGLGTKEGAAYSKLKSALDKDMKSFAETKGGNFWKEFQAANAFYGSEYKSVYDNQIIKRLIKTDPNLIVDKLSAPNHIYEVDFVKRAIGNKDFNQIVKPGITNKLMGIGKEEVFNPKLLETNLKHIGDETLAKVYSPPEITYLKGIAKNGINFAKEQVPPNFLKTIAESYPETIINQIILNPGATYTVRNLALVKSVVKPETWSRLRDVMTDKIWQPGATGYLQPKTFASRIEKFGDPVLSKFYDPTQVQILKDLKKIGNSMQTAEQIAGNPSGTGQTILTYGQLGWAVANPQTGIPAMLTPPIMAKLYVSNLGKRYLLSALHMPAKTPKGLELSGQLLGLISQFEKEQGE
jgi:hypothetical protein